MASSTSLPSSKLSKSNLSKLGISISFSIGGEDVSSICMRKLRVSKSK